MSDFEEYPRQPTPGPAAVEAAFLRFAKEHGGLSDAEAQEALEGARALQQQINLSAHPAEAIIDTGGTMLCVETEDGLTPGMSVVELDAAWSDDRYERDSQGLPVKTVIGKKSTIYDFGDYIDSSDFELHKVAKLAEVIFAFMSQPEVNRIVVVMGTDTMAHVAAAVAQMIENPSAPIVFSGSMEHPGSKTSDAGPNFHRARFAADLLDPGVYLDVGDRVMDARRASKIDTSDRDAFRSLGAIDVGRHETVTIEDKVHFGFRPLRPRIDEILEYHQLVRTLRERWDYFHAMGVEDNETGLELHQIERETIPDLVALQIPGLHSLKATGRLPLWEDLAGYYQPRLNSRFDNAVVREHVYEGYRTEWLEKQLESDDVHGVILSGIERIREDQRTELLEVIKRHSHQKPIMLFENPSGYETRAEIDAIREATHAGAYPTQRMTIEWSTTLLKRLLAKTQDVERIKELWADGEKIGMAPYISNLAPSLDADTEQIRQIQARLGIGTHIPDPLTETASIPRNVPVELEHNIRYIPLTFGHDPKLLEAALASEDLDAVILGGFGAGNLPKHLLPVIEKYAGKIPIVMTSLCPYGECDPNLYGPGVQAVRAGVISAGKISWQDTAVLLDNILRTTRDLEEIRSHIEAAQ